MERMSSIRSLAALLATLAISSSAALAQGDDPPPRTARLGLAISALDENWRESNAYKASGVMVLGVDPRGRAAASGIVAGDVLVSVAGRSMRDPSDLGHAERSLSPDQAVSIVLARDRGRSFKIFDIPPVGAAPATAAAPAAAPDPLAVGPTATPDPPAAATAASPSLMTVVPAADPTLPAAVAPTAAVADTTSRPAASSQSVSGTEATAGQTSAAAGAAPLATSAGAAGGLAAAGAVEPQAAGGTAGTQSAAGNVGTQPEAASAGTQSAAGAAASSSASLAAPVAVGAVAVAATVADPGASTAPSTATVDSVASAAESAEPAPAELGVVGQSLTPDLATALGATGVEGILVLEVSAASPADRSGLRAGDIILKVGAQPVSDMREFERAAAASTSPISISTLRLGKPRAELVALDGPPPVPTAAPSQEQLLMDLHDEVRALRREVQSLRKKLGK